ncbi:MAG: hypothetical protein R2848_02060 [Thermomicrobiales bacterium]
MRASKTREGVPVGTMNILGIGLAVLGGFFGLIALIPFLGWLNWITTLPLAILAGYFSYQAYKGGNARTSGLVGLVMSAVLLLFAVTRLGIGGGLI